MAREPQRYRLGDPELDRRIDELIELAQERYGASEDPDAVRQILASGLRLVRDGTPRGDLKLLNNALKELRHAFRVFGPWAQLRKVSVFGSARTPEAHPEWHQARSFAERMAEVGWMTITGAGPGVMTAAQQGAGREASFGVNIRLPFEQQANHVIAGDPKLINFRYFFTRKVMFVKESHAITLLPGGFGTHDEGFEALTLIQTGKSEMVPVVFLDAPGGTYWREWRAYVEDHLLGKGLISEEDMALFRVTDSVDEAVTEILGFYRNYQSSRYVGSRLALRVHRAPSADELARLNADFKDLLAEGEIEVTSALPEEGDEVPELPRVVLPFNRRDLGRLRLLIDRLNQLVSDPAPPDEASPHEILPQSLPPEAKAREED